MLSSSTKAAVVAGLVSWITLPLGWGEVPQLAATLRGGSIDEAAHQRGAAGEVPEGLTADGWTQMREQIDLERYQPRWVEETPLDGVGRALVASNPNQRLDAYFCSTGLHLVPREGAPWRLDVRLTAWGWAGAEQPVEAAHAEVNGSRAEYRRGKLTEWYVNQRRGLEQGFTITEPPPGRSGDATLVFALTVSGDLEAEGSVDAQGLVLRREGGVAVLRYTGLVAWDSAARELPARIEARDGAVVISVTTGDAPFPVTVDPLFTQVAKLLPSSDPLVQDGLAFGHAVAIDGDTAVVGVYLEDQGGFIDGGSAYVFTRSGTTWSKQQKLVASDAAAVDWFGYAVGISGDTAVIGAHYDDHAGGTHAGSAYVFARSGTTWIEQQKLTANDAEAYDQFGFSVAISGDTAVIGAPYDSHAGGTNAGSAYVFTRSGTTWIEQQKLTASDPATGDCFGISVAISGDTVVVGAFLDDHAGGTTAGSAYVFARSGTTWSEQQKLTADDSATSYYFGISVAISGEIAVVGAMYDDFAGVNYAGSAYVFTRTGTTWSKQQRLTASDPAAYACFGVSVATSSDTVVVGAYLDDHAGGSAAGSAYVFRRFGTTWSEQQKLTASDPATDDCFGISVAISGDTVVVGAYLDDHHGGTNAGAAYVFTRFGTAWGEQQKLIATDSTASDRFGTSVAVSADTAVVGAASDDHGGGTDAGSAYVFRRSGTTWSEEQKLTASDSANFDQFGISVAISGDTTVIGAHYDGQGGATNPGSAYVFVRSGTGWSEQQKLVAGDAAWGDHFGISVGISGDTAVIGAYLDHHSGGTNVGSAYVFTRSGTTWTEQQKLTASDATSDDRFGRSVAISGDTAVIGAPYDDHAGGTDAGSAYVFTRSGTTWIEQQKLTADDSATRDGFGISVAISGDTGLVGAHLDDHAGGTDAGSAYVFTRSGTTWIEQQKLTADDSATRDCFGRSVAISGGTGLVGAHLDDHAGGVDAGSAYVFEDQQHADLVIAKDDGMATAVPGQPVTYTISASNRVGPGDVLGGTVSDTFPSALTACSWTCVPTSGAACTAGPVAGDLNDLVDLPVGGAVTYTATCTVHPSASGMLVNAATVMPPVGISDPDPGNNSATDVDALTPQADLWVTKTNHRPEIVETFSYPYTIAAANPGPSDAPSAAIWDPFPPELTGCTWTCIPSGGATCTATGAGDLVDLADLPAGATATYTAACTVVASSGTCSNTVSITPPAGLIDTDPTNNSATDVDHVTALAHWVFGDGFESCSTAAWWLTVPAFELRVRPLEHPVDEIRLTVRPVWARRTTRASGPLVAGFSAEGEELFAVTLRHRGDHAEVRARTSSADGASLVGDWVGLPTVEGAIEIDWRRSLPRLADGCVTVSLDGVPLLELGGLDNGAQSLAAIGLAVDRAGRPALEAMGAP